MTRRDPGILLSELRHVTAELQRLCGAPCRGAWVLDAHTVVLDIGRETLLLETWPVPRMHTITRRPPSPSHPLSFQGLLRARAHGPLLALEVLADDRAVALRFPTGTLEARLFGRAGGIWWVEGERVIAGAGGPAPSTLGPLGGADGTRAPRFGPQAGSWDLGARAWFEEGKRSAETERWRTHVRGSLRRRLTQVVRRITHVRDDLARAEHTDQLRAQADALAASLHRFPGRAAQVTLDDLHGGPSFVLHLDPSVTVVANLRKLYDRASRLERSAESTLARLIEAEAEEALLIKQVAESDVADLAHLHELSRRARLGPPPEPSAPVTKLGGHWRWRDAANHLVRVGRHDAGNHELVFRASRGRDTWLHLLDRPSPHVVVTADGKQGASAKLIDVGEQLLLLAAKVPVGESAEVQRARVADLRAIPGGRLGAVRVLRAQVHVATRRADAPAGWMREDLDVNPVEGASPRV
jgi:predicted ribosome quality control (RQC) complex YloA/Tae2 family protein